ncbi:MAG: hypothetical protein H6600_07275 [Flavobacteriales bacterium]|nr:hypothetical protein [Flavobacteriales bacterium]MCB9198242.1 hypothetical protein [Flavobacteriales bacterium]
MHKLILIFTFSILCNLARAQETLDYSEHISIIQENYLAGNYHMADSLFLILMDKYEKKELNDKLMAVGFIVVDEFYLKNGNIVRVTRMFKKPVDFADITYQFVVLNKKGTKIKRIIHTEKSFSQGHFICEYQKNKHLNYGGWQDDNIDYAIYKSRVLDILN